MEWAVQMFIEMAYAILEGDLPVLCSEAGSHRVSFTENKGLWSYRRVIS